MTGVERINRQIPKIESRFLNKLQDFGSFLFRQLSIRRFDLVVANVKESRYKLRFKTTTRFFLLLHLNCTKKNLTVFGNEEL